MNPAYFYTWTAKSSPAISHDRNQAPELFDLELRLRPEGEPVRYWNVYIPKSLRAALADGAVKGIYLETLALDSLAYRVLPGDPRYIVLGLVTRANDRLTETPRVLLRARQLCLIGGTILVVLGMGALLIGHALAGALAVVAGTHCWRTGAQVPREVCLKHTEPPAVDVREAGPLPH